MAIVDEFGQACDRMLRVHIRKVHRCQYDVNSDLKLAQKFYGKYGVRLELASATSIHIDKVSHARVVAIESDFRYRTPSKEQIELYERYGATDELFGLTVFIVFELRPITWAPPPGAHVAGAANCAINRPFVFIAENAAVGTLAHEIGHVLMPGRPHTSGANYMMDDGSKLPTRMTRSDPIFTAEEILVVRQSPLLRVC